MVEINNKKSATDRYLNYIYNDKNYLMVEILLKH